MLRSRPQMRSRPLTKPILTSAATLFATAALLIFGVFVMSCAIIADLDDYDVIRCDGGGCDGGVDGGPTPDGSGGDGGGVGDGAPSDAGNDAFASADADAGDAAPNAPHPIFMTQKNEIWRLDPLTKAYAKASKPNGCGGDFEELAIDKNGFLFATNQMDNTLYRFDKAVTDPNFANGNNCTQTASNGLPSALTFSPAGMISADEVLVGYNKNGDYVRVDRNTAVVDMITPAALGQRRPSGDYVIHGSVGYVSVTNDDCSTTDCLLQVNPVTGAVTAKLGNFPSQEVEGLAYTANRLYGFARDKGIHVYSVTPFAFIETIPTTEELKGAASVNE